MRTVLMKCGDKWASGRLPVVIDCFHMHFADYTAAQGILELYKVFNARAQPLILFRLKPSVKRIVTELMVMDDISHISCQTQLKLEKVLKTLCVPSQRGISIKGRDQVLQVTSTEEQDLSIDCESPSIIYPGNTTRQHIARMSFTLGDSVVRISEELQHNNDRNGKSV